MNSKPTNQFDGKGDHEDDAPAEVKQFVPCEAAVTAISLCLIAYFCFRFFRPYLDMGFRESGIIQYRTFLDAAGTLVGLCVALISIPVVLIAAAWNASYHGYNLVRNRVLIYLIVMFVTLAIDLLIIFVAGCWMNLLRFRVGQ